MAHHFLSLVTFRDDVGAEARAETEAASHRLLGSSPLVRELRVGRPAMCLNIDREIHLVIEVSVDDAEAFESFRAADDTRQFSEQYLRSSAEDVIHVTYDAAASLHAGGVASR